MQKPLSPKTLEKRYAELGLSDEKLQLLHTFFRCASNFYGVLPVSHAWQVFKHYEGLRVHKKDFVAFSGVAQRDASLPYASYELRELYSDEPWGDPLDRAIVNKDMVMHGYYRFLYVYNTLENQRCQSFLVPDQEIFLSFAEDRFYLTPQGKAMVDFLIRTYKGQYAVLQVGTGDSPATIPFYEACGFRRHHVVRNFFTDHYDHPIYECGVKLVDMVYLQREL